MLILTLFTSVISLIICVCSPPFFAVHFKEKPYKCDICAYQSGTRSTLNKHVSVVHKGAKPFQCQICPQSFGQKGHLQVRKFCPQLSKFFQNQIEIALIFPDLKNIYGKLPLESKNR